MSGVDTTAPDAVRTPGRPRSARADEAIMCAVFDLLDEGGSIEALSVEAIAARAGVGKATIYRRWPNKDALLLDAIRAMKGPPPVPPGRTVREDLVTLLRGVAHDERTRRITPCLVPEVHRSPRHHHVYQEFVEERREVMREVLRRGVRTGELRNDLDIELTTALLTGPVLVQRVLRWHPGLEDEALPERVVETILAGIAAR